MPETQEETMHPKDVKGTQPEQLVEEVLDHPELYDRDIRVLATALSECREAGKKMRKRGHDNQCRWVRGGPNAKIAADCDCGAYAWDKALAAQPPSEASERSGT